MALETEQRFSNHVFNEKLILTSQIAYTGAMKGEASLC